MSDTTYNGWTNYATWRVNLEVFDGCNIRDLFAIRVACPSELAAELREYVEEMIEETTQPGLGRDYALAFLSDVNWHEIANNLMVDLEAYAED
jgi:hypothetical protein